MPARLRPIDPVAQAETAGATPAWLEGVVARREASEPGVFLSGHLVGIDGDGRPLFRPEGEREAIPVAIGADLADATIVRAARHEHRALVVRTGDTPPRWLLVGLVRERVAATARDAKPGRLELRVDGERMVVAAEHDLELRCGRASITLRYDGRVEIRGTHILSASRGPNRVKGATIALN